MRRLPHTASRRRVRPLSFSAKPLQGQKETRIMAEASPALEAAQARIRALERELASLRRSTATLVNAVEVRRAPSRCCAALPERPTSA